MNSPHADLLQGMDLPREVSGVPVLYGNEPHNDALKYIQVKVRGMNRLDLGEEPPITDAIAAIVSVHNRAVLISTRLPREVRLTKYGSTTKLRWLARPLLILALKQAADEARRRR